MEQEEIKQLIPLYVAGTLSPEEARTIEKELNASTELQEELRFWKMTSDASVALRQFAAEGHPSTSDLEAFASWALKDQARRKEIENHLQGCDPCTEAYKFLKEIPDDDRAPVRPTLFERVQEAVRSLRLVYAVPAMAMMLIAGVLVYRNYFPAETELRRVNFVLEYQPEIRSGTPDVPVLTVPATVDSIHVQIAIPNNPIAASTYSVTLRGPNAEEAILKTRVKPFFTGLPSDSIQVVFGRQLLRKGKSAYRFLIREESQPGVREDLLLQYSIPFTADNGK